MPNRAAGRVLDQQPSPSVSIPRLMGLFRRNHVETGAPAVPADDPEAELRRLQDAIAGKVPSLIQARVDRICTKLREILPRIDNLGPGSAAAHAVVATATSYLPEAVGNYLRLPRDFADNRPVSGAKTSLLVLCDQLDLLASKMGEVYDAVCLKDADALVAHGRFLKEKFGSGTGSFNLDGDP